MVHNRDKKKKKKAFLFNTFEQEKEISFREETETV